MLKPGAFKPKLEVIDFTKYHLEATLFDTMASECVDIAGFKINYYIHDPQNIDRIYGEDPLEKYKGPYLTKIMYRPEKETNLVDVFGIASGDTIVSAEFTKTTFTRDVSAGFLEGIEKPKPKDAIKTLWNNKLYEIVDVADENKVFLGNKLIWTLTLRPFKFSESDESVETMLFTKPTSADMPLHNDTTESLPTSAYGDNDQIGVEAGNNAGDISDIDSRIYGYFVGN